MLQVLQQQRGESTINSAVTSIDGAGTSSDSAGTSIDGAATTHGGESGDALGAAGTAAVVPRTTVATAICLPISHWFPDAEQAGQKQGKASKCAKQVVGCKRGFDKFLACPLKGGR